LEFETRTLRDVTKERRDVLPLVETKRSISFLWGCVDGNIVAPESLAAKPAGFHANCVLSCLWHLSSGLWQPSSRFSTNSEVNFLAPSFEAWQVEKRN
jgi:hypothetical protein